MTKHRFQFGKFVAVQLMVISAFAVSYAGLARESRSKLRQTVFGTVAEPVVEINRWEPLQIEPLYNDPEVVSDEELAAVLKQIHPKFSPTALKPNFIEHALRTWGVGATFADPAVMSGLEMRNFMIDHAKFLTAWEDNADVQPLLIDRPQGIAVRWGSDADGSVHHDHWLASLTEAGIDLDQAVFAPPAGK